jgi:hypothetical protein
LHVRRRGHGGIAGRRGSGMVGRSGRDGREFRHGCADSARPFPTSSQRTGVRLALVRRSKVVFGRGRAVGCDGPGIVVWRLRRGGERAGRHRAMVLPRREEVAEAALVGFPHAGGVCAAHEVRRVSGRMGRLAWQHHHLLLLWRHGGPLIGLHRLLVEARRRSRDGRVCALAGLSASLERLEGGLPLAYSLLHLNMPSGWGKSAV